MHERAATWFRGRSYTWRDWSIGHLLTAKRRSGMSISLVIPARNEQDTVGGIVAGLHHSLVVDAPLIDEIVVIDSDSVDDTAAVAAEAGATVHRAKDIRPDAGARRGKGEALWKSLFVTSGDVLVFVDADLTQWGPHFVTGLLGPLLTEPEVQLVRAAYTRLRTDEDGTVSVDGGRLTELVARPLISLHWPELSGVAQPLAGEWAARRDLMESLPIPVGYGVELSTLVDTVSRHGLDAVAQVHLGVRAHRHRSDEDMALAATELLAVAESRREPVTVTRRGRVSSTRHRQISSTTVELNQFKANDDGWAAPVARSVTTDERPPAAGLRKT